MFCFRRLHLHIVSKDFYGMSAKKWNTFNTEFLVSIDQVIKELEDEKGKGIIIFSDEKVNKYHKLENLPYKCSICHKPFSFFSDVKDHYKNEYDQQKLKKKN